MISFHVPGKPAPQGSKKHVGRGILVEASKALKPWRTAVAKEAVKHVDEVIEKSNPVSLELIFIMARPKSTPKSRRPPAVKRPDIDKLARAVLDALTGVLYEDDSQVTDLRLRKEMALPGESPGLYVNIN